MKKRKQLKSEEKKIKNNNQINKEIIGIIIISFGILVLISMYSQATGYIGEILSNRIWELTGFGGYIIPYIVLIIGILFLLNKITLNENKKSLAILIIYICFLTILDIHEFQFEMSFINKMNIGISYGKEGIGGGLIGSFFAYISLKLFGIYGSYVVLISTILIALLLLTNKSIIMVFKFVINKIVLLIKKGIYCIISFINIHEANDEDNESDSIKSKLDFDNNENEINKKIKILDYTKNDSNQNKENLNKQKNEIEKQESNYELDNINLQSNKMEKYIQPSINLLKQGNKVSNSDEKKVILDNAKKLEKVLNSFGIKANVIQITKGPTITRYELQLAPGIKVSKILSLSDDIALGLASSDVRIEAPIPGKSAVGVEVPNKYKANVRVREVIESKIFDEDKNKLIFALGKDIAGKPVIANIEKMPHLLIAGATGSGKSVCLNTLITSILYKSRPDEVKMLLIDPKVVELSIYNGIPHLLIPVVTDPKKASGALNWAVQEMEKRYKLFADEGVRDIESYNIKAKEDDNVQKIPKVLLIIDELADLMMVSPNEVEDSICRLAQMARAAGIHLVIAPQRPSVTVITGTIKANVPSRISFAVSSQTDSRTILDMGGAEKLLGKGDMLFYPVGSSKPVRIQGAYIEEKEVKSIVDFLSKQYNELNYNNEEIIQKIENNANTSIDEGDELLSQAIELVVNEGQASISFLQRKLRIGYTRAARLIDDMEERGIVGGYEGSKPRKVLISKQDMQN